MFSLLDASYGRGRSLPAHQTLMNANEDEEVPTLPLSFRLRPSRNQKQRSKLSQAPEETPTPSEPAPAAPTPAPVANPSAQPVSKKVRLKRSGQMHEDLTAPIPQRPAKKETEY